MASFWDDPVGAIERAASGAIRCPACLGRRMLAVRGKETTDDGLDRVIPCPCCHGRGEIGGPPARREPSR